MIKVNLLKSRAVASDSPANAVAAAPLSAGLDGSFDTFESSPIAQFVKLLLLIGFVAPLVVYEKMRSDGDRLVISQKRLELQEIQELKLKKSQEILKFKDLDKKKADMMSLDHELSEIKKGRLTAVKGVDTLQSLVPSDVWLTSISYSQMSLELDGQTLLDSGLDRFVTKLKNSDFLSRVNVRKDVKLKSSSGRTLNEFKVTVDIEGFGEG